jgi:phosphatidate cytidylyltransferase
MEGLLKRGATALFFVIVMLGGLYAGRYSFVLLFALITVLCLWEFYTMVLSQYSRRDLVRMVLGLGLGMSPFLFTSIIQLDLITNPSDVIAFASLLFFPLLFLAFIYELYSHASRPFTNVAYLIVGMIYIGVPFAMLDFIAFKDDYFFHDTVFGLLLMTWSNDTAAYVIGSKFGRHKLFPRISPNKTWEGTAGGTVVTFLIAVALSWFVDELYLLNWIVLAVIVSVFGSFGDLVESMLKRSLDVKDSGSLLPGHGGMLDRFDGFIFLLPYATAYLLWIR